MKMKKKIIASFKAPISKSMGPHVRQVIPSTVGDLDPFVFLDHFGPFIKSPDFKGVPPHPHAGIATITYLLEGSNRHQDSYDHEALINTGDLAWMQAGKGIVHAEGLDEVGTENEIVHGLQFWISLPAKDKFNEPDFFHYKKDEFPVIIENGVEYKIVVGELKGEKSPVTSLSPAMIFDISIPENTKLELPIQANYSSGIYVIEGEIEIDGQRLVPTSMTKMSYEGEKITIKTESSARIIVLGGLPLNEPIVGYASFVMNSMEQIQQVMSDYQMGKMGQIL
jgi:redox-sensitive bicupin YhaK (pirin superfamily)